MHRAAYAARGDGGGDLLEGDEVLTAAANERTQVRPKHVDALAARTVVEGNLGFDTHQGEQIAEHIGA